MSTSGRSRRQLLFCADDEEGSRSHSCNLCLGRHSRFSTPGTWKSEDARSLALSLEISPDDLVCYACRRDITRLLGDTKYTPRWVKDKTRTCCIAECHNIVFASLQKQREQLCSAFETAQLKCTMSEYQHQLHCASPITTLCTI